MIFRFVADYSHSSDLRREFAHDPESVLDRYEIPEAERRFLLAGDRDGVARQLHGEIDDMVSGKGSRFIIWIMSYPRIVGRAEPQHGPADQPVDVVISALNVLPEVRVRFHLQETRAEAEVLQVDHDRQSGLSRIHCRAQFPAGGRWDTEVANVVDGREYSDLRRHHFEVDA